jgi:hypothetical protein
MVQHSRGPSCGQARSTFGCPLNRALFPFPPAPGTPGRLSYGAYITFLSVVTFALWILTIAAALVMAAQLCWLLLAFFFEAALKGVE